MESAANHAVIFKDGEFKYTEVPKPELKPNQVLI